MKSKAAAAAESATTKSTIAAAMTTAKRRRIRRPSPSLRRRMGCAVAVVGAAVLAATCILPGSAEGEVPSPVFENRNDPHQAHDGGGGDAQVCSSSTFRQDTSGIQKCAPPNEGSDSDGTCRSPVAAAATAQTASKDPRVDRSGGDDDDADADDQDDDDGDGNELEDDELGDDDERFVDELEDDDDDMDEHRWDADVLGPYQDRDMHEPDAFLVAIRENRAYLSEYIRTRSHEHHSSINSNSKEDSTHLPCENEDVLCTSWALQGECDANPSYMKLHCPVACHTCHWRNAAERCRPDPNGVDALKNGDLDRMMERIVNDPDLVRRYDVEVVSRPSISPQDDSAANRDGKRGDGMWLVVFHNFLSKEEADHLISLGEATGYAASEVTVGFSNGQAVSSSSQARTSWNTWCSDQCSHDPVHGKMIARASDILQIGESNFEDTQLLRYQSGQYYKRHNDFIDAHLSLPMGPRILTLYVHLSDNVSGGGTHFPVLNATVMPKAGRAVLWPSVLNKDPRANDPRSDHEALPVHADSPNIKYGANIWVHQQNFKEALARACA